MENAKLIKSTIEQFAISHRTLTEDICIDNYIIVNNQKCYLQEFDWQILYKQLLTDKFSNLNNNFIVNEEKNLKLNGLKDTSLQLFVTEYTKEHQ